jgi:hypothetical protein
VDWDSAGRATFAFSAVQLTPTEWIDTYVLPACVEAGMTWVARGTQDYTTEFDLDGEYVTALEILRAMQQAGRAPGELVLRRNGATDYKIDLLVARGSTAATVRVQTQKNLLAHQRTRRYADIGTKIIPRGNAESVQRGMAHAMWRVQTVVSGTQADLEDPNGGADPIAYDDQLNGWYVAPVASTFSSQQVTDSATANSRITVASTAGWTAGTTLLRFFRTSTSAGEEVIGLTHPTRVTTPASGGFGVVTRILDVAGGTGDSNLLTSNPWMTAWATNTSPADGYTKITGTAVSTTSRESTTIRLGTYSYKFIVSGSTAGYASPGSLSALDAGSSAGRTGVYTPTITPYTTAARRHSAHTWVYISARTNGGVQLVVADATTLIPFAWGPVSVGVGQWTKLEVTGIDCSTHANGVVCAVITAPDWIAGQAYWGTPWYTNLTFYVDAFGFAEADAAISDVLYSGGTALWQRANVALAAISDVVTGYSVTLADLARLDDSDWSDEPLTVGGNVEIVDADLAVTTTQRVVELEQDLLNPLNAAVQLATAETQLTKTLAGGGVASSGSIGGSTGIVTTSGTAAGLGVTDVYTKAEVDALLEDYPLLDGTRQFTGPVGINTGAEGFSIGKITYSSSGQTDGSATDDGNPYSIRGLASANLEVLWIIGRYGAATHGFIDQVVVETHSGTVTTVMSSDLFGTPPTRTYTISGGNIELTFGGSTSNDYIIRVAAINSHG